MASTILLVSSLCICLCFLFLYESSATPVLAQAVSPSGTTFTVTTVTATSSNPNFGPNIAPSGGLVYAINGVGANGPASLILIRGGSYIFDDSSVSPFHPFYVSTDPVGEGAGPVPGGGPLSAPGQLTYIADPTGTGNTSLFFDCQNHPHMGGNLRIIPGAVVSVSSSSSSSSSSSASSHSSPSSTSSSSINSTTIASSGLSISSSGNSAGSTLSHFAFTKYDLIILATSLLTLLFMV